MNWEVEVEGDDQSSSYESVIGTVYDELAPVYERIFLRFSQYYRHLYNELYEIFGNYFDGIKIHSKVLDLGSGTGIWTMLLRKRGYHVVSLDISRVSLTKCVRSRRCSDPVQGDAVRLPFRAGFFDAVVAYGSVFNHIVKSEEAFREVSRVLSNGGYLLFDVDNLVCPDMAYEALLGGISIKGFLKGLIKGRGHVGYWYGNGNEAIPFRFFTIRELLDILSSYGFEVVSLRGIHVLSNIIPSRMHQWSSGRITKAASLLYSFDRVLGRYMPFKYVATTFLIVSRKLGF
ncbi:class I SAM-dependent methyltransferase [Vulcanisaeta sp. JCM 16159]|uniref:class I SAM-dependent methyltransferase n=1 Tax=Vulcanisaeta sp. JCM 16159 TaxID=1295371 RepID=UPI0006D0FE9E|nr:class I SAM-dependent methyltransferase [Vulcanisaeta sp. JCM 16159]